MNHLLIIDPQNDFCDLPESLWLPSGGAPALPVAGAHGDMLRLSRFINTNVDRLDDITVTLDSHPEVAVERTTFWQDAKGRAPAPFTAITAEDVEQGRWLPRKRWLTPVVTTMLRQLHSKGRPVLMVWPVHCVEGSWGHQVHPSVEGSLEDWSNSSRRVVHRESKGGFYLSEHYGAFEAEVPFDGEPDTHFNVALARRVTDGVKRLIIAGEASSHCVSTSGRQLLAWRDLPAGLDIVLLSDAMSPVTGFEAMAEQFFRDAAARGVRMATCAELGAELAAERAVA